MDTSVPVIKCVTSVWVSLFPCYTSVTFGSIVMMIYSVLPTLLPVLILAVMIWKRNTSSLLALIFLGLIMLVCEAILKNAVRQARPTGSCDCTYGMPSSHSATSFGFLVWIYLELGFPLSGIEVVSTARGWDNPQYRRLAYLAIATICFVPVPFSRVYFHYHTVGQVLAGIFVGTILALGWFGLLRGILVPKAWLDKFVQLRPFRIIRAINDYRPQPNSFISQTSPASATYGNNELAEMDLWGSRTMDP